MSNGPAMTVREQIIHNIHHDARKGEVYTRTANVLQNAGCRVIADAANLTREDLRKVPGYGPKTHKDLVEMLAYAGLTLKNDDLYDMTAEQLRDECARLREELSRARNL